jgi:NitT/TauT family transport system permease protein
MTELTKSAPEQTGGVGLTGATGIATGLGGQGAREIAAIIAVAVLIIGGGEFLLRFFEVPQYILPKPSQIAAVFASPELGTIAQHYGYTLVELFSGYAIGASIGLILAAVITQFPFVEKVITPYILLLVTTPMLALVPLLILNFGFGYTPRIIAVALASGPMVMINAATGFRRVDAMKIALAKSCGASTLQVFMMIRVPMAMPMVIVGLMIGAIFGMITAVGAEMSGGGFGLGSRLTTYSSTLRMPEFFACILVLAVTGIAIYVFFFWLGKKLASWES